MTTCTCADTDGGQCRVHGNGPGAPIRQHGRRVTAAALTATALLLAAACDTTPSPAPPTAPAEGDAGGKTSGGTDR